MKNLTEKATSGQTGNKSKFRVVDPQINRAQPLARKAWHLQTALNKMQLAGACFIFPQHFLQFVNQL
jgi:hypothetical protein